MTYPLVRANKSYFSLSRDNFGYRLRNSRAIAVVGGPTGGGADVELRVTLLTTDGLLFLWRASTAEFLPCVFSVRRPLRLCDLAVTNTGCLFTTQDGEAFLGFFRDVKKTKTGVCVEYT